MISSLELFEELYRDCRELSIEEVIKKHGGGTVYIPSYKSTHRDEDLWRRYQEGASIAELKREFGLSESTVREIIRKMKSKQQPRLDL